MRHPNTFPSRQHDDDIRPGTVLRTARANAYGTEEEEIREETVTKVTRTQITTQDGARYSRTTWVRHGDGGLTRPRYIARVLSGPEPSTVVELHFERVGRAHDVRETIPWTNTGDLDGLAEAVYRKARRHIMSREFDVSVYKDGRVSLEYGRFGEGTWAFVEKGEGK